MKRHALAPLLLAAALLAGCGQSAPSSSPAAEEENATADFFAMDTYMSVSAFGEGSQEAVTEAEAEVHRLDALLSTGEAASEVGKINADGGAELPGAFGGGAPRGPGTGGRLRGPLRRCIR